MTGIDVIREKYRKVKGKTIAVVYIFEGDNSSGFEHFYVWKGKILTQWMNAIDELHCMPLILDVRTFVDKAINGTLPHIDYVLNMNSGTYDLSSMALVPSTCSSLGIPCIPCSAVSIVTGENKTISNHIAKSIGLNIPQNLDQCDPKGIFRPVSLGNSMGVTRGTNQDYEKGIYQEFISGYDITTPVVYNAVTNRMELFPTVMYLPDNEDLDWFYGEKEKQTRTGIKFKIVQLDPKTHDKYRELADALVVQTFCRIDARVKCSEAALYHHASKQDLLFDDIYFVEINVMPTIRDKNSFCYSFNSIDSADLHYPCIEAQKQIMGTVNINSFLLASSMLSFAKTMY